MYFYRRRTNYLGPTLLAFVFGAITWALVGDKVKEKIGESSDFQRMKKQVMDRAAQIRDISRDRYDAIVDEVTTNYGRLKDISQNELKDMAADLKFHWYRIKDRWNQNSNSGSF